MKSHKNFLKVKQLSMWPQNKRKRSILRTMGVFEGVWFPGLEFLICLEMDYSSQQPEAHVARVMFFALKLNSCYHFIEDSFLNSQNRPKVRISHLTSPKLSAPASQKLLYHTFLVWLFFSVFLQTDFLACKQKVTWPWICATLYG